MGQVNSSLDEYEWIVVLGGIFAVFCAYGIGANDVANAFATSVGAKVLTIRQACMIAAVAEFLGALLLGGHVTKTIAGGIADPKCFKNTPGVLMYGMMCVIIATGTWLLVATKYEAPVSTTHSVVGAVIGMTLVTHGPECVLWAEPDTQFPYTKGVSAIVISWFLSPVLSAIVSAAIYWPNRFFVLRRSNSRERTAYALPVIIFLTVLINIYFIILKGGKGKGWDDMDPQKAGGIACGISGGFTLLVCPMILKKWANDERALPVGDSEVGLKQGGSSGSAGGSTRVDMTNVDNDKNAAPSPTSISEQDPNTYQYKHAMTTAAMSGLDANEAADKEEEKSDVPSSTSPPKYKHALTKAAMSTLDANIHEAIDEDEKVYAIHDNAEKFDEQTERRYSVFQVLTATCDSFSHGANDVANSIGPFAAIWTVYRDSGVKKNADMGESAYWILALGGFGIVLGLATMGADIMRSLGVKLVKVTPSRGFSIELGAALIVLIGSAQGWPLSTTHCQVGSTIGVGLLEKGGTKGVNFPLFGKYFLGWVLTLAVAGLLSAALTAQGVYAPSMFTQQR